MKRGFLSGILSFTTVLIGIFGPFTACADVTVYVDITGLSPNVVNIVTGEAVYWYCADNNGPYEIASNNSSWTPFSLFNQGDYSGLLFSQAGTYNYTEDATTFASGTVVVTQNIPPTVAITNPTNNAVFNAPALFGFDVDATDTDPDGMSDVEFYVGTNLVDDVLSPPYSTAITNLPAGAYQLTAIAYDIGGLSTSASINILVQNQTAITLTAPTVLSNKFIFTANGLTVGKTNILQASTNISSSANWKSIKTNVATSGSATFTNTISGARNLFRILQLP